MILFCLRLLLRKWSLIRLTIWCLLFVFQLDLYMLTLVFLRWKMLKSECPVHSVVGLIREAAGNQLNVKQELRWGASFRVRTGPGKPGQTWNFILAFSRTGKSWKKAIGLESSENLLNSTKNYEVYGRQWGELTLRSWKMVNANFRALEKSIWLLEKSWNSPGNLFLKRVLTLELKYVSSFLFCHELSYCEKWTRLDTSVGSRKHLSEYLTGIAHFGKEW